MRKKTQRDDVSHSSIPEKRNPHLGFRRWQLVNVSWMYEDVGDLPPLCRHRHSVATVTPLV